MGAVGMVMVTRGRSPEEALPAGVFMGTWGGWLGAAKERELGWAGLSQCLQEVSS